MFFDPETTAVLIVDLQNDFLDPVQFFVTSPL